MRGGCSPLVLAVALCAVARAETTIPWDQAAKHVGEETTIEGRVLGKIETRDGKPEIVVAKSEDLALVAAKKRDEHEERVTQAQTEAIERLGDVLTHIEDLTE